MHHDKNENMDNKRYNESQDKRQNNDTCSMSKNQKQDSEGPNKLSGNFLDETPKPEEKK